MRFFEAGEEPNKTFMYEEDGDVLALNNDNYFAALHEVMDGEMDIVGTKDSIYDKVWVKRGEDNFREFWRADYSDDDFSKLEYVARRCGTLLIRQTVSPFIKSEFDARFSITDNDLEHLLEEE